MGLIPGIKYYKFQDNCIYGMYHDHYLSWPPLKPPDTADRYEHGINEQGRQHFQHNVIIIYSLHNTLFFFYTIAMLQAKH